MAAKPQGTALRIPKRELKEEELISKLPEVLSNPEKGVERVVSESLVFSAISLNPEKGVERPDWRGIISSALSS